MYKLNVNITDEAEQILKAEAKRYGCGMGAVITRWAIDNKKTETAINMPIQEMLKALEAQEKP